MTRHSPRSILEGIARDLDRADIGYYRGGTIPPKTPWPVYLYSWGAAEQQLVVNLPLYVPDDSGLWEGSLQILTRAATAATAEAKACQAADLIDRLTYPDWGGTVVSNTRLTAVSPLGVDGNQRPMWVVKARVTGITPKE